MRTMAASAAALVAFDSGSWNGCGEAMAFKEGCDPLETPLQRTHDAIFVARGQPRFPLVHPARIPFFDHRI